MTIYSLDVLLFQFCSIESIEQPAHCSMSDFNCCFLTCIQISQEVGKVVWYSHPFKSFPKFVVIHTVKNFSVVNKAEVDFFKLPCFIYGTTKFDNLFSGSSAFSKSGFYFWKFSVHVLLNPNLKDFEHYLPSMWNKQNCMVVWTSFGIAFLWD